MSTETHRHVGVDPQIWRAGRSIPLHQFDLGTTQNRSHPQERLALRMREIGIRGWLRSGVEVKLGESEA